MSRPWRFSGRTEQRKAALKRKLDAARLANQGRQHCRGAMYLGGYAIECKLKAIAMEVRGCDTLSDLRDRLGLTEDEVYTHGLERLVRRLLPAGTHERLLAGAARDAFVEQVNRWSPQWRYDGSEASVEGARAFLEAVDVVWNWLERNV